MRWSVGRSRPRSVTRSWTPWNAAFERATNVGIEAGAASELRSGQRAMLRCLLQARFGESPATPVVRLQAANLAQLEARVARIFDATKFDGALSG